LATLHIPFDNSKELQVKWKWEFERGTVFIPYPEVLPMHSTLDLVL
jgi:hypothetical protein